MIAATTRKGRPPNGYEAACVTFDTHSASTPPKDYWYWVPHTWKVKPGDKLQVIVSERSGPKQVTVRDVCAAHCLSVDAEHKTAAGHTPINRGQLHAHGDATYEGIMLDTKTAASRRDLEEHRQRWLEAAVVPAHLIQAVYRDGEPVATPKEPTAMNIQNVTLINGNNIANMTDDQLFDIIAKEEAAIKALRAIENKPQKLKDKINKMQADIDALILLIDAR